MSTSTASQVIVPNEQQHDRVLQQDRVPHLHGVRGLRSSKVQVIERCMSMEFLIAGEGPGGNLSMEP
jgi:hypothetical protein